MIPLGNPVLFIQANQHQRQRAQNAIDISLRAAQPTRGQTVLNNLSLQSRRAFLYPQLQLSADFLQLAVVAVGLKAGKEKPQRSQRQNNN